MSGKINSLGNASRLYLYALIFMTAPPFSAKVVILRVVSHLKNEDEARAALAAGIGEWMRETAEGQEMVKDLRYQAPSISELIEYGVLKRETVVPFLKKRDVIIQEVIEARATHFYEWNRTMVDVDTVEMMHTGAITSLSQPGQVEIAP